MKKAFLWVVILVLCMLGRIMAEQRKLTIGPATESHRLSRVSLRDSHLAGVFKWDRNGFLIRILREQPPQIFIYDRRGRLMRQIAPMESFPEAEVMSVGDVVLTSEGSILVAVTVRRTENEYTSALLEYAQSGNLRRITKVDPFVVKKMALDSNGNIWVLGYDWQQMGISFGWPMIRQLSPDGVWLTSALLRSFFPENSTPLNIAGPGVVVSDIYFDILGNRMYVWLPGVNQLITLDLTGRIREVVNEPFRRAFGDPVTSVEVISLVFMPGSGVMAQIRGYGEGGKTRFGWIASSDLGQGWIRVIDWRVDPMATRLVGLTQRGEAVCLRVIRSGDVKIELAPIGY